MEVAHDDEKLIERVAALDIGKAEVVCCVRVPGRGPRARRMQEVRTYTTMTRSLLAMSDWLAGLGVTRVVMEATGDYWKAPFYLLENTFETWLVNAKDVKHLPGRPKTDRLDAVWLCKVAERQTLQPSFVPPPAFRQLRDLTRYRADLITTRTAEKQRVEKLLEDPQIKVSVVVSDVFGVSGRDMMRALIAGERDPKVLADLARGPMRGKTARLEEAFTGRFTDHHAFLLRTMIARVDGIDADIKLVQSRIETPAHLASWAKFAPGVSESAGRKKGTSSTGHGNRYLARVLGEAAVGAGRTKSFLGERYRRIARRRGKKRAIVAVGRSILMTVWVLLNDEEQQFVDLGPGHYESHTNRNRSTRNHVRELQAMGYNVILEPAA